MKIAGGGRRPHALLAGDRRKNEISCYERFCCLAIGSIAFAIAEGTSEVGEEIMCYRAPKILR